MLIKKLIKFLLIPGLFLSTASSAFAWGEMGHKLVGGIAEEAMSQEAKDLVRGILGIEPLAIAAIFPDQVRDDARFGSKTDPKVPDSANHDFSAYHFCEIPVGYDYFNRPKKPVRDCHGVMKYTTDVIKDPRATRESKMIALRYLIHVVGDVHQPLHVGNGYDRGANACKIKWQASIKSEPVDMNLHAFWDETIVDNLRVSLAQPGKSAPKYFGDVFKALKAKNPDMFSEANKKKYAEGSLTDWLMESQDFREKIYPDEYLNKSALPKGEEYKHRPYCIWYLNQDTDKEAAPGSAIDPTKIPVLGQEYASKNIDFVSLQIIKGGLRLASLLDKIALEMKDQQVNRIDDKQQESILELIHTKFKNIF